jgi:hypothetical protein
MKKKSNKLSTKLRPYLKELIRKFFVKLKKNPSLIPLVMLIASFLVFSLNLTDISDTTSRIQGKGMGLCGFTSMLLSILSIICMLNAFPKRRKPNYPMVGLILVFFALIIYSDITYINRIVNSTVQVTQNTMFIITAQNILTVHIVLVAITAVTVILEPLFAKLLKKINTSVNLEETSVAKIELVDEE